MDKILKIVSLLSKSFHGTQGRKFMVRKFF